MEDILFVAGTLGFFALGLAYVRFCDRIVGPDPVDSEASTPSSSRTRQPVEARR